MVQLGAFSDKNTALEAWKRLSERYGDYFVGKEATILNGKIAEQEIYRLRVYGFNDINESRRLVHSAARPECRMLSCSY